MEFLEHLMNQHNSSSLNCKMDQKTKLNNKPFSKGIYAILQKEEPGDLQKELEIGHKIFALGTDLKHMRITVKALFKLDELDVLLGLLTLTYPSPWIAYVDEEKDERGKSPSFYYSVLVKVVDQLDHKIYHIKLLGHAILGEGRLENQNSAIIFTHSEDLQIIDMNQNNYLEGAFKMRNLLRKYFEDHGVQPPPIPHLRMHISMSSETTLARIISNHEASIVTIWQRLLANPPKVRFHHGHLDRLSHITRGGVSKASRVTNLSEDIFAGLNPTLRQGNVIDHEDIQVGRGCGVAHDQTSLLEANIAS